MTPGLRHARGVVVELRLRRERRRAFVRGALRTAAIAGASVAFALGVRAALAAVLIP
jgi:hypothetical protein